MIAKADLDELVSKYETMLRLRDLHDRAQRDADFEEPDPRPAMQELSSSWPGSLRELDVMHRDELVRRLDELRAAVDEPNARKRWMTVQLAFHHLARSLLAAKRWLREHPEHACGTLGRPEVVQAFVTDASSRVWADMLERVARPPRGRLMDLVFERLRVDFAATDDELKRSLFGARRPDHPFDHDEDARETASGDGDVSGDG